MTEVKTKAKTKAKMPQIYPIGLTMGCDPEFFFSKPEVGVVGSESIIPKNGMVATSGGGKFVIDGVQAELNPLPNTCRESVAYNIRSCFITLKAELEKVKDQKISLDFSRSVEISKEELAKLAEANQRLGCAPSLNTSKSKAGIKLTDVDGSKHLQRSAGGHIHVSGPGQMIQWNHREIVHMLDLLVGNTCVLLDRDPANKERRKLYGRAGEYRLPIYPDSYKTKGLEYRTLSNFWLTAYPLMSLVFGLTRTAVEMVCDPYNGRMFYEEFTKLVPAAKVRTSINTNNPKLAMEIYRTIEPLLMEVVPSNNSHFPLSPTTQTNFGHFVSKIETDGLEYWFKQDPLTHWTSLSDIVGSGFWNFAAKTIGPDRVGKAVVDPAAKAPIAQQQANYVYMSPQVPGRFYS